MAACGSIPPGLPRWPRAAPATSSAAWWRPCSHSTKNNPTLPLPPPSTCMASRAKLQDKNWARQPCWLPTCSVTSARRSTILQSMKSRTWRTRTEEETIVLGRELAPELSGAVLLIGNLGAGKTTLAKGIVEGRGAATADEVASPTFTLIHQYGEAPVYHIDLYRLDEPRQVES